MNFVSRGIRDYLGVTPNQPQYAAALANPNLLATGLDLHPMQDKPPFAIGGGLFGASNGYGGTNPIFFDALGLDWRAGFRMSF